MLAKVDLRMTAAISDKSWSADFSQVSARRQKDRMSDMNAHLRRSRTLVENWGWLSVMQRQERPETTTVQNSTNKVWTPHVILHLLLVTF